jgi:hypothetical protein
MYRLEGIVLDPHRLLMEVSFAAPQDLYRQHVRRSQRRW